MKKFSALIISLVMIAAMLVPCAVSAADTDVTVTNFQNEDLGEYTGNLIYNPEKDDFVKYTIEQDTDGTKYLHADFSALTAPHTKQSRSGVRLFTGNENMGFLRVEARIRVSNVPDWYGNTLAFWGMDPQESNSYISKLGYISDKGFAAGITKKGQIDINGTIIKSEQDDGEKFVTQNTNNNWYRVTFVVNPKKNMTTSGYVSYTVRNDKGELLGSAVWTCADNMTNWRYCYSDLILVNEYLNNDNKGIPKNANIDVSEVKVTSTNVWKVNVSAGEGGTASADGDYVEYGGTANINVTPNEGYEVDTVTVDGNALVANESGAYEITNITKDTDVAVTFKAATTSVPTIDNVTVQPIAEYEDSPAAVVYAKVNGVAKGAGVVLKNAEGKEITLPAFDGDNPLTTGAFGIKVFGKAMETGKAYSFIPYITYAGDDGDVTVSSEAKNFTFGTAAE